VYATWFMLRFMLKTFVLAHLLSHVGAIKLFIFG
jgi:hypothetical protein